MRTKEMLKQEDFQRIEELETIKKVIKKMKASDYPFGVYYNELVLSIFLRHDEKSCSFSVDFKDGGSYHIDAELTNYNKKRDTSSFRKADVIRLLDEKKETIANSIEEYYKVGGEFDTYNEYYNN